MNMFYFNILGTVCILIIEMLACGGTSQQTTLIEEHSAHFQRDEPTERTAPPKKAPNTSSPGTFLRRSAEDNDSERSTRPPAKCSRAIFEGSVSATNRDELRQLDGFMAISGDLTIRDSSLTNFRRSGVHCLSAIGGDLKILNNIALESLQGFNSLYKIGDQQGGSLLVQGNPKLKNLEGLDTLRFIGGDVGISWNQALVSLEGLENLKTVRGGCLAITANSALSSCKVERFLATMYARGFSGESPRNDNLNDSSCTDNRAH